MQDIIDGIMEAMVESRKRNIEANVVMINDRLLYTKLQQVIRIADGATGLEVPMVCGLRAYYTNELPENILFAVAHTDNVDPRRKPKQVEFWGDGYDEDGELIYDQAKCPECGRDFEYEINDWGCKYCCDCGQALDWGEGDACREGWQDNG